MSLKFKGFAAMQFCLTDNLCKLFIGLFIFIFLIHAENSLKTVLNLLCCIPDAFKITFHYTFSRVFKLECSLNVKHCYEFIVAYSHL